ncbi:hypothetical protein FKQ51_27940 [Bacillus toyonensis]|uniref:exosporium leader peptide-containing protein n=1 Tax=Bacillus toyonensis TaxID=155322 RepID=UPI002709E784|nr:exosporium leader peptide-containing protein [Bacillus toyonensis]MDO8161040.1 hypothetical protein [Bacillus toyonensis]
MSDSNKKLFNLITNEILFAATIDPQLIGPTFSSIPPFTIPTGPTGDTGPTGNIAATEVYGQYYSTDSQTVNINSDVLFNLNGQLKSTHFQNIPPSAEIQVDLAGDYLVIYHVLVSTTVLQTVTYCVTVGGTPQIQTVFSQSIPANTSLILSGSSTIFLSANTNITLRNTGSSSTTLPTGTDINSNPIINASLQVIRLDIG